MSDSLYATPILGVRPEDCTFYHRLDIPALRDTQDWHWDLLGDEARYLGGIDFGGRRVLEVGPANGALSFWMERQGAEVVACDLSPDVAKTSWDVLLREGMDLAAVNASMSAVMRGLNNGFWYAHAHHRSQVRLVHATAYDVPPAVGRFDVVTLCAVLLHLRDPLRALEHALGFTDDLLLITDLLPFHLSVEERGKPLARFLPSPKSIPPHGGVTWWHVTPALYEQYLDLRGFDIVGRSSGRYRHQTRPHELFHLVARRRARP
ncbi:MAG TPA: methyltransferase domain-containing protein [Methylibium sp.]|nr:methyltransferase domain-containing protein [Methylibium sp.]